MTQPLVLPVRPVHGWQAAEPWRRALAALAPALVAAWAALLTWAPALGDPFVAVTGMTVGPFAFYCAARVLRPHVGDSAERVLRHVLAAASTCFGTAVLVAAWTGHGDFIGGFAALASLGLVVTLPWGVVSLVVRAARTPVPPRSALPLQTPMPRHARSSG